MVVFLLLGILKTPNLKQLRVDFYIKKEGWNSSYEIMKKCGICLLIIYFQIE